MKKNLLIGHKKIQYFTLITSLLTLTFLKGISQVSLTTMGAAYTQNFDALANSGTSSSVPTGWVFSEAGGNTLYTAGTGSSATGDTYSFGSSSASDRAFGTLLSGSVNSTLGASFINGTGSTITSLNVSYIGEQWRLGATGRVDRLNFEYSLDATSLTTGSWTAVTALNFVAPITTAPTGTLDGNLSANRTSVSSNIGSLSIAVGGTVWIRWTDFNATSSDDGLAIDDFSLTPNGSAAVPPTKLVITSITPTSPIAGASFSVTVQAQDAANTTQNVLSNTAFALTTNGNAGAIGGTLVGTINAGSNSVVISGVTLATAGTNVDITATRTSGDLLSAATSATFNVLGIATQLAFVNMPSTGYISTNIAPFTVEARRADNSVDVNYTGNITVSKASGPGTLSGTTVVAAVAGVATFSVLQFDQIGNYSLNTTSSILTPTTSTSIVISPSPVTWDFTTSSATNIPSNLSVSVMSQGNNNGTTTMITNGSSSSGYTGASGGNNAGAAARTGSLNIGTNGSAYFEFTLTPDPNYIVTLNAMSFGSRSTGTGPTAYSIRSSIDNFGSNISSGSLSTAWVLSNSSFSSISSNAGSGVTFRIYGHSGSGSPSLNIANWRIDDVLLNLSVNACTQPNISVNSGSICENNSFTITPTGGVTYSVTGNNFTVSPTANTDYTVTGADAIGCTNTAISSVIVNTSPTIFVNSGSICSGNSFTILPSGANTYTISGGLSIVSPTANTDYTVTGTSTQGCLSNNQAISSVTVNALPVVSITGTSTLCAGTSSVLTASGALSYLWNTGDNTTSISVSPSSITVYTLTGVDAIGCSNFATHTVSPITCNFETATTSLYTCNLTISNKNYTARANPVTGAQFYRFSFYNLSAPTVTVASLTSPTRSININNVSGLHYGKVYKWTVAIDKGIGFGPESSGTCTINISEPKPTIQCGKVLSNLATPILCTTSSGTSTYKFTLYDNATNALVAVKTQTSNYLYLSQVPGVGYNNTYKITVQAEYNDGSGLVYSSPSSSLCTVTITEPMALLPCGNTYTSTTAPYTAITAVGGVSAYKVNCYNISTNALVGTKTFTNNYIYIKQIPGMVYGTSYYWTVQCQYNNGTSLVFGSESSNTCMMTWAASGAIVMNEEDNTNQRLLLDNSEDEVQSYLISMYPNPVTELLNINFDNLPSNTSIEIYNMIGELVLTQSLSDLNNTINTNQLSSGLYHAKVIGNNKLLFAQKIIKQ